MEVHIKKIEEKIKEKILENEDLEKENLDSKLLIISEFNEQNKLMKFYRQLIFSEINDRGLNKIRQLSRFSDKDNSYIVPIFQIKKQKVVLNKIPRHEQILIIENNQKNRKIKINTNNLVKNINLNSIKQIEKINLDKNSEVLEDNCKNVQLNKNKISKINFKNQNISHLAKRRKTEFSKEKKRKIQSVRKNPEIFEKKIAIRKNTQSFNKKSISVIKNKEILRDVKNKEILQDVKNKKKILNMKLFKKNTRNSSLKPIRKFNKIEYYTNKKEKIKRKKNHYEKLDKIPVIPFPFKKLNK